MAHPKVLAIVLAGGKGERLFPLTAYRSKPSVPFGGRYRIVDFALSNMINSHIYSIYLMVQYKSQSLIEHIRRNWVLSSVMKDHFVTVVPPQMRTGPEWFQGTADAVLQNIDVIHGHEPELVVIFGADHIYRMDVRQMIDFHISRDAYVTVAARPVPLEQASAFGVIRTDEQNRIIGFEEKPQNPTPMPGDPTRAYVSMGNYIFGRDVLVECLTSPERQNQHDFGAHILPRLVKTGRVFAYNFEKNVVPGAKPYEENGYWRDVGTIKAFYDAHMDMLGENPKFELENKLWPIHPSSYQGPATKFLEGHVRNSLIAEGVVIKGATISNSVIRRGVVIEEDVIIEDSILMDFVVLKRGCRIRNAIVDKVNMIKEGESLGYDEAADCGKCFIDPSGIRVLPKFGRLIEPCEEE